MTIKPKYRSHNFTLLELIVAMGIFSVLMLLLMQFFNSAQKLWTESERRNTTYADARIAMDLMTGMLQTYFYQQDAVPFYIERNKNHSDAAANNRFDRIYFVTQRAEKLYDDAANHLFAVSFSVDNTDNQNCTIRIRYIGDDKDIFNFSNQSIGDFKNNLALLTADNTTGNLLNPRQSDIIPYVTRLRFEPMIKDATHGMAGTAGDFIGVPYAIRIVLSLLDRHSFARWKLLGGTESALGGGEPAAATDFREENERTFTRMVYLGDRNE